MQAILPPKVLQHIEKQHPEPPNPRRNGKIARLPKETRDMINRMLDDGLPYRVVIDELGEAGEGLNAQNITNWVQGGYQDYLRQQQTIDRVKAQMEFAADLLRGVPDADPMLLHRACNMVAGAQLFHALLEHGDEALRRLLEQNPARYLTMLNTVAITANASINIEKHHLNQQILSAFKQPLAPSPSADDAPDTEHQAKSS